MTVVIADAELRRIVALPRRPQEWSKETADEAVVLVTEWLKTPEGTMQLLPIQVRTLAEAHDTGVCVGLLGAGAGKTLISGLLSTIWQCDRTLLLVPAALRKKTIDDLNELRKHFRIVHAVLADEPAPPGPVIRVLSYESLSSVRYAAYVEEYDPDLVVCDESHMLQTFRAGRTKRLLRFIKTKRRRGEKVRFVPETGTGWGTSIKQMAHLFEAALEDGSPLPIEYASLEQWSLAIDQNIKGEMRLRPGALDQLDPKAVDLESARVAVRDRILQTPGVIVSRESACGLPLILQQRHVDVPECVQEAMRRLRLDYELPNGDSVPAGLLFSAASRQLANGFAYYSDPRPPLEWRTAHKNWNCYVRERLKGASRLDTPLQVWNECENSAVRPYEFDEWVRLRDTFKPNCNPFWVSDYLVRDAEKWALETGGIVWVSHSTAHTDEPDDDAVGGLFRAIPYFGAGDERIRAYKGPCAASLRSHGTGKNLQQWDEALIMTMPSGGKTIEQLLARLHRTGQKSPLVRFWFYAHSLENQAALETAQDQARFVLQTSGAEQRILNAHILGPDGGAFVPTESDGVNPMFALPESDPEEELEKYGIGT